MVRGNSGRDDLFARIQRYNSDGSKITRLAGDTTITIITARVRHILLIMFGVMIRHALHVMAGLSMVIHLHGGVSMGFHAHFAQVGVGAARLPAHEER